MNVCMNIYVCLNGLAKQPCDTAEDHGMTAVAGVLEEVCVCVNICMSVCLSVWRFMGGSRYSHFHNDCLFL